MMFENLLKGPDVLISVKGFNDGLRCFADTNLKGLSKPNKALLKHFLEGVITELK
jgi:hypothetical protein